MSVQELSRAVENRTLWTSLIHIGSLRVGADSMACDAHTYYQYPSRHIIHFTLSPNRHESDYSCRTCYFNSRYCPLNSKRAWKLCQKQRIKIYSRILEFTDWEHSQAKTQKCFKEEGKVKSSYIVKSTFLRIISPAFLALGSVHNCCQSDVRQSGG